jgi:hypothetical protein
MAGIRGRLLVVGEQEGASRPILVEQPVSHLLRPTFPLQPGAEQGDVEEGLVPVFLDEEGVPALAVLPPQVLLVRVVGERLEPAKRLWGQLPFQGLATNDFQHHAVFGTGAVPHLMLEVGQDLVVLVLGQFPFPQRHDVGDVPFPRQPGTNP